LVAGVNQCVKREGIVVGSGDFFFKKGSEDACIGWSEEDGVINSHASSTMRQRDAVVNEGDRKTEKTDGRADGSAVASKVG
jgi:hypothetical protein